MSAQTHRAEVAMEGERTSTTMDRMTLIEGLNHDFAGEYRDILMHIPYPRELRAQFQAEVSDEHGDAGGKPTSRTELLPHALDLLSSMQVIE